MDELRTAGGVVLRALREDDHAALQALNAEPSVDRRWPVRDGRESWLDGEEPKLTILVDGEVAGLIQYTEELEPDYKRAAVDLFLGERFQGRGVGTDALRRLARFLFDQRGHHRIEIDPAADNLAAIRCYEKVGFKPIGIVREAERDHDGAGWHDALLMDLLRAELTDD